MKNLTKKIIQERLETIPGYEYNIRMDDITGEMLVEVPDDENIEFCKRRKSIKRYFLTLTP
mgnify:CR=1 FL=1